MDDKILDKDLYSSFISLKRCEMMDSLPLEMREKSLEFANAIAAIEGLPVSKETENSLSMWVKGQRSFKEGYISTLKKYRIIEE